MTTPTPYTEPYYTRNQVAELLDWTEHDVSQRAPKIPLERLAPGLYSARSVDRYLLARELTRKARLDGYTAPRLLWPDDHGQAHWGGHTYNR